MQMGAILFSAMPNTAKYHYKCTSHHSVTLPVMLLIKTLHSSSQDISNPVRRPSVLGRKKKVRSHLQSQSNIHDHSCVWFAFPLAILCLDDTNALTPDKTHGSSAKQKEDTLPRIVLFPSAIYLFYRQVQRFLGIKVCNGSTNWPWIVAAQTLQL